MIRPSLRGQKCRVVQSNLNQIARLQEYFPRAALFDRRIAYSGGAARSTATVKQWHTGHAARKPNGRGQE
jgi:hypothetical protein